MAYNGVTDGCGASVGISWKKTTAAPAAIISKLSCEGGLTDLSVGVSVGSRREIYAEVVAAILSQNTAPASNIRNLIHILFLLLACKGTKKTN